MPPPAAERVGVGTVTKSRDPMWKVLFGHPIFGVAAAILALVALPYTLPILTPDQLQQWGWHYAKLPVSIATLMVLVFGVQNVRSEQEQRFWHRVAFGYAAIVAIRLVEMFLPASGWSLPVQVLDMGAYLAFYSALFFAINASREKEGGQSRLQLLHTIGLITLAATALAYFEVIPWVALRGASWPWYPSLFLYGSLDIVLALVFLRVRDASRHPRWRSILGGMAVVCGLYAIVDLADALFLVERFQGPELHPLWDLLWFAGDAFLIGLARVHLASPDRSHASASASAKYLPSTAALVAGLFCIPLIHMLLYYRGVLDPRLHTAREVVVIGFLGLMGLIVLSYFRILERDRAGKEKEFELQVERVQREALLSVLASERDLRAKQRRFLADAGHEIRTPLTVLRGDFEVTLLQSRSTEEYRTVIDRAVDDLKAVSTLANALIHVAQADTENEPTNLRVIDLTSFVPEIVEGFRSSAAVVGLAIDVEVEPCLSVHADPTLLGRALGSLVDNAVKYAASGGSIRVRAEATELGRVHLIVTDRGPGMDVDDRANCFDRFYRGSNHSGVPGTGLGLPISKAIMERFGGGVEVRARDGGGTTFVLWLPGESSSAGASKDEI